MIRGLVSIFDVRQDAVAGRFEVVDTVLVVYLWSYNAVDVVAFFGLVSRHSILND